MKLRKWVHIDFFFKSYYGLDQDERFMFEDLVKKIILSLKPFIRRKFYLYEPQPNCFLALEVKAKIFIPLVSLVIWIYKREYDFIEYMYLHSVSGKDETNGEGFCDVLNAMTDYYLFKKDAKLHHIIHCCLEFQMITRSAEVDFYKLMVKGYEEKKWKVKNGSVRNHKKKKVK